MANLPNNYDYRELRGIANKYHDRFSELNYDTSLSLGQKVNFLMEFFKEMLKEYDTFTKYLDDFISKFDENLYNTIDEVLLEWKNSGKLAEILKELYDDQIIYIINELQEEMSKYQQEQMVYWENYLRQMKEILESIDPNGVLLNEIVSARTPAGESEPYESLSARLDGQIGLNSDFRSFEKDLSFMKRVYNEFSERGINVKWFGVKGDGVTDDGLALKHVHEVANNLKLPVIYPTADYYISEVTDITVKTSVDWCNSNIIINDKTTTVDNKLNVYVFKPYEEKIIHQNDDFTKTIALSIKKDNKDAIPEFVGTTYRLFKFIDETKIMYARYGANATEGVPMSDYTIVSPSGAMLTPLTYDFNNVTRVEISEIPKEKMVLKNANFISKGNNLADLTIYDYYNRNLSVLRSNVLMENITHTIDNDFANKQICNGFLQVIGVANIHLKNMQFQPRLYHRYGTGNVEGGTYELFTKEVTNLKMEKIWAYNDSSEVWGFHAGNYMKNVEINECEINRFDSHYPSDTIKIFNSIIGAKGLTLNGYGLLLVEDTTFNCDTVLGLRQDYGSFWIGDITFRRIKHYPVTMQRLIRISPRNNHDFGMRPSLGINEGTITVDDYWVDVSKVIKLYPNYPITIIYAQGYDTSDTPVNDYYYRIGGEFIINNVRTNDFENTGLIFANIGNYNYMRGFKNAWVSQNSVTPNVKVKLSRCNLMRPDNKNALTNNNLVSSFMHTLPTVANYNDVLELGYTTKIIFDVEVNECRNVYASFKNMPATLYVRNSTVVTACNISNGESLAQNIFENCLIAPRYGDSGSSSVPLIDGHVDTTIFELCRFRLPLNGVTGSYNNQYDDKFFQVYNLFSGIRIIRTAEPNRMVLRGKVLNCTSEFDMPTINRDYADYGIFTIDDIYSTTMYRKSGTTAQRPLNPREGTQYYDTTLTKTVCYKDSTWV